MTMHWTQIFLAATLAVYVGAFVVIMVTVRKECLPTAYHLSPCVPWLNDFRP